MILENKTKTELNIDVHKLTRGSNKKVYVKCDLCGAEVLRIYKNIYGKHKHHCNACKCKNIKVKTKLDGRHDEILQLVNAGYSATYIAKEIGVGKSTINRYLKKHNIKLKGTAVSRKNKTIEDKYGISVSELSRRNLEAVSLRDYGVPNRFMDDSVKEKIRQTSRKKYKADHHMQVPGIAKRAARKGIQTKIENGQIQTYRGKLLSELADKSSFSRSHFYILVKKHGLEKALSLSPKETSIETSISDLLDDLNIKYKKQYRVEEKIADFMLPEHRIIIECDGLYWHSDAVIKDKCYHARKRKIYIRNGFTPLFFRSDEIEKKLPIIKSIIQNKVGQTKQIYARKCDIRPVEKKESVAFFAANHLMGAGRGPCLGLYFEDELVCALQVVRQKPGHFEISRFCPKRGASVPGGFSRLLKRAITQTHPTFFSTFIDLRYGNGSYLEKLGFRYKRCNLSFKWTDGTSSFHRLQFRSNTGYAKGLHKIWDCGQSLWCISLHGKSTT